MITERTGSFRARSEAAFFGLAVSAIDLIPPHFRYGYAHRITRRLFQRPLPSLVAAQERVARPAQEERPRTATLTCALVTGSMDIGGIGSVVEMLAAGLPSSGVRPVVICTTEGTRATRLRARGIDVIVADASTLEESLRSASVDVIELHGAPAPLEDAVPRLGIPFVTVLHNTEIHYSRRRWRRFGEILDAAAAAVSVSALVRDFHARHVSAVTAGRIRVVPNAAGSMAQVGAEERAAARRALDALLPTPLADDIVFVCLARYDSQKNVAGLVSSFLSQVTDPRIRLVIAGEPSDWAEVRRADAIRRCSVEQDRVTLLSTSDARTLLAAADAFILNSFFEGWPVAATEAAAMGLPLILSDVGGARELVERDAVHSVLVGNAAGPAAEVTDARVARARRRSRRQANAAGLGAAVHTVAERIRSGARPDPVDTAARIHDMIEGHAAILRDAASKGTPAGAVATAGDGEGGAA